MENMVSPWRGRRVFLTGHTGFKGSWLAIWLAKRGACVRGYALAPDTDPNLFSGACLSDCIDDIRGDIRDRFKLEASLVEFAPDVIFHLAAQPLVRRSYADPIGTYLTNVMGTAHLLEAARKTPSVRAIVCVTTDKCYENQEWVWPYRETDPLGGHDPYASSKACAEIVSAAYRNSFFPVDRLHEHHVALATARAGNVIGGGDWSEDRLIPDLIRGFIAKRPVLIRRPNAVRPWQHVLDALHGYILLAEQLIEQRPQFATAYNFGPSDEDAWPVEKVATEMANQWGDGASWARDEMSSPHESRFLRLDASKARSDLGWHPRLNIQNALEWTLNWYRRSQQSSSIRSEMVTQIDAYEELLL
jgi:CDP-glucose 4,6-dehydratase